jgi:CRISPR-associated protein Csm3
MSDFKFLGKYIIKADVTCVTGLHIGGTEEGFEIGGVENIVIKDPLTEYPYIPGSSLKGKIRGLLEWSYQHTDKIKIKKDNGKEEEIQPTCVQYMLEESKKKGKTETKPCDCGKCDVCIVFGFSADAKAGSQEFPTRLTVRDSFPKGLLDENGNRTKNEELLKEDNAISRWETLLGENIYTEVKMENVIDRITSEANPRQLERVPAGSVFEVEMIYDIYKESDKQKMKLVFEGINLLEDSALGGSGSRGSGKVKFNISGIEFRSTAYYLEPGTSPYQVPLNSYKTAKLIIDKFEEIDWAKKD